MNGLSVIEMCRKCNNSNGQYTCWAGYCSLKHSLPCRACGDNKAKIATEFDECADFKPKVERNDGS